MGDIRDAASVISSRSRLKTIAHSDLTDADTQEDVTVITLPAHSVVEEVGWHTTTQFAFGGAGTIEAEIGVTGTTAQYADAIDIDGGTPSDVCSNSGGDGTGNVPDYLTSSTAVVVRFDSTTENVGDTTAGEIVVWVKYYVIPVGA